jgi:hypothetical protein
MVWLQQRKSASSPFQPSISAVTAATRTGPHSIGPFYVIYRKETDDLILLISKGGFS